MHRYKQNICKKHLFIDVYNSVKDAKLQLQ